MEKILMRSKYGKSLITFIFVEFPRELEIVYPRPGSRLLETQLPVTIVIEVMILTPFLERLGQGGVIYRETVISLCLES